MSDTIPPGERRELRSVVRSQFKVLRTEVKQRELELTAEAERRLMERYRDEDKKVEDLNWRMQEIVRDAQRQIEDLMRDHGEQEDGGGWGRGDGKLWFQGVSRKTENRTQLRRALEAGIREQVRQASLALDRQEADLLRALAMEGLESTGADQAAPRDRVRLRRRAGRHAMTPAEELVAAAAKLRETATAATPGPWEDVSTDDTGAWPRWILGAPNADGYGQDVLVVHEEVAEDYSVIAREDLAWIALASPALAEPLAAWLESWDGLEFTEQGALLDDLKYALKIARVITGGTDG